MGHIFFYLFSFAHNSKTFRDWTVESCENIDKNVIFKHFQGIKAEEHFLDLMEPLEKYVQNTFPNHKIFEDSLREFVHSFPKVAMKLSLTKLCDETKKYISSLI